MWPDWVSNPGPLTYKSGALPTVLRGPVLMVLTEIVCKNYLNKTVHFYIPLYINAPNMKG